MDLRWVTGAGPTRAGAFAEEFGVTGVAPDLRTILADPEVDVVDFWSQITSTYRWECRRPRPASTWSWSRFTASSAPHTTPPSEMLRAALASADQLLLACRAAAVRLCYAENWVYAAAVQKGRRLLAASGGPILRLVAEESHSGTHAAANKRWATAGGGSLLL